MSNLQQRGLSTQAIWLNRCPLMLSEAIEQQSEIDALLKTGLESLGDHSSLSTPLKAMCASLLHEEADRAFDMKALLEKDLQGFTYHLISEQSNQLSPAQTVDTLSQRFLAHKAFSSCLNRSKE